MAEPNRRNLACFITNTILKNPISTSVLCALIKKEELNEQDGLQE